MATMVHTHYPRCLVSHKAHINRVALGILMSNVFNLVFSLAPNPTTSLRLILAAPAVPAIMLAISLYFTPESPRFYLRPHRGNYNPEMAYRELKRLRNTEVTLVCLKHTCTDTNPASLSSKCCGTYTWSIVASPLATPS